MLEEFGNKPIKSSGSQFCKVAKMLGEALQVRLTSGMMAMTEVAANDISEGCVLKEGAEEEDVFIKLWHQAMAEVDFLKKLASATSCDKEELVQEKEEQYKEVPLMQVEGVYGMKGEAETMVDRMHSTLKEEQGLKEEKVTRGKKEWHEISPLVADKLLPPDREVAKADSEVKCNPQLKAEVVVEAGKEIGKRDISFPHEPGAGTIEKATLVKLMSTETRLKCAIKALDSLCNTEVETLNWDKLKRISGRLEEHWSRYEDAFTAYQKLFNQYSRAADKRFFTLSEAFMAVDQRAWTLCEISFSGGNAKYKMLLEADLEKYSLRIKKVQLDKVEMYMCSKVPLIIDVEGVSSSKPGPEVYSTKVKAVERRLPGLEKIELKYVHSAKAEAKMDKMQSAQGEAVLLKKIEQGQEEEMFKEEMDLEADKLLAVELKESRSKEYFAEAAEQPDFEKLMLKQFNLNTKEVEKHADATQLNYMMKAETEAKENRMQLEEVEQSLKVEMKLMHALKAEAVQVRNMEQNLMKEGHEALQLLVNKQAAAAG